MPFVDGPDGPLEVLVTGSGDPVTVFAHGLAGSIDETRPFGSGVSGTRVFFHFRGHGSSYAPPGRWTYGSVESELRAVVTAYDAHRALGVSLGGGAILRAVASTPDLFERFVLVLPGAFDRPRHDPAVRRMERMAGLVADQDLGGLATELVAEQPVGARDRADVGVWADRQARRLAGGHVGRALLDLPTQYPIETPDDMSAVTCPVLVVAQRGDPAHPVEMAREIAARLPAGDLVEYDDAGLVWAHRAELRTLVSTFLNTP